MSEMSDFKSYQWRKMTNFELSAQVPLIIRAPWLGDGANAGGARGARGARSSALVELVDMMPTIAELAGVPLPTGETPLDGVSLVPLLSGGGGGTVVKDAAYSQYPRRGAHPAEAWHDNSIIHHARTSFTHMGYSVRTDAWRYTEWVAWNGTALRPMWGAVAGRELYDHRNETLFPIDFDARENENLAGDPARADVVASLSAMIRQAFGQEPTEGI